MSTTNETDETETETDETTTDPLEIAATDQPDLPDNEIVYVNQYTQGHSHSQKRFHTNENCCHLKEIGNGAYATEFRHVTAQQCRLCSGNLTRTRNHKEVWKKLVQSDGTAIDALKPKNAGRRGNMTCPDCGDRVERKADGARFDCPGCGGSYTAAEVAL